jgi:tetratricopeptide (TPR) repeat protein
VARALAASGQYQQAEKMARAISDPHGQALTLAALAEALANAGEHQRAMALAAKAEEVARAITDSVRQGQALAAVAAALADAGDPRSKRVAASACIVADWLTALRLVLLLEPSAHTVVASI